MKKWLTLPLAAGCLVLLAMPALANEGHMNRPSDLSTIPVKGSYQEKLETETAVAMGKHRANNGVCLCQGGDRGLEPGDP